MTETFVVIGGDAAGMSAASKARREDRDREILVFEKGDWVSYAACGLPYYVKGDVDSLDELVQVTPEAFRTERDIDLRTNHEVVGIDPVGQTVTVSADDNRFEQPYDQLLVATGALAIEPPFAGMDLGGESFDSRSTARPLRSRRTRVIHRTTDCGFRFGMRPVVRKPTVRAGISISNQIPTRQPMANGSSISTRLTIRPVRIPTTTNARFRRRRIGSM